MASRFLENFPRRWRGLAFGLGAALVLFFAYGQALTQGPFGINDDYQYLYRTYDKSFDPAHNELMGMGRPLNAWGVEILFGLCDGKVARMVWLRAASILGVGLFAWTLFRTLAALRYSDGFALTVAALFLLLPACGVYAGYACAVFIPYSLIAVLFAGRLLIGPGGWKHNLVAGLLIFAACATWQAAAPLAMFPALAIAWRRTGETDPSDAPDAKPWWRPWLIGGLAVAAYAAMCWLIARFGAVNPGGVARMAVAVDWRMKTRFLIDILRTGVTSWARLQPDGWEWTVGALMVALCAAALVAWRDGRVRWIATVRRLGLAVFMILLSVAPLLAAKEDNGAFRSVVCLYIVILFLAVCGARQLLGWCPDGAKTTLVTGVLVLTTGAARYHVWHGLVEPSVREYVGLRDQVRRQFPDGPPARLVYLLPSTTLLVDDRLTPSWEYGLVSTPFWWVTRPFLVLIFAETSPSSAARASSLAVAYREADNPGVPVLDATPVLLREPGEWRDDPQWGRVCAFRGGWLYLPWFGYINVRHFPAVQHHVLGALTLTEPATDGGDLWFYHAGLGHFHTRRGDFPHLWLAESKRWVFVTDDSPAFLSLFDDVTKQPMPYPP